MSEAENERNHQNNLAEYDANSNINLELFKAAVTAGQNALKTPLLINGGGAIAILTFIGKVSDNKEMVNSLSNSLIYFSIGVLLLAFSTGFVYLSQSLFALHKEKEGKKLNYFAIFFVICSYITFLSGIVSAYNVFTNL